MATPPAAPSPLPLFVDLDGTLTRTDLLVETATSAIARGGFTSVVAGLLSGRARLKHRLAEHASIDPGVLPYRPEVLAFLRDESGRGRPLVLATAADQGPARAVADHLGIFDAVLASDGLTNLKGRTKLAAIQALCRERGWTGFAYLGDSAADLPVWEAADERHLVSPSARVARKVARMGPGGRVFEDRAPRLRPLVASLRPHHWLKNGLLFLPVLLAHQMADPDRMLAAAAAFAAFSLAASAVYVINDAVDVQADRHHPDKRSRPFAAGRLPLAAAPGLAGGLLAVSFGLSLVALPAPFTALLAVYLVTTSLYSLVLKRLPIVDVITLAGLYALRVLAGGTATEVPVSQWLMVFSIFLFTSLAFCKRYSELLRIAGSGDARAKGRGYEVVDIGLVESVGPTSGLMAVLVLALYISSEQVQLLYRRVDTLWALIPLLLFWIIRLWFLARRGERLEDPVVFAATDPVSLAVLAAGGLLLLVAS